MTLVFSVFSFIVCLAHPLPVCQGHFVNMLLVNQYFHSRPICWHHLQITTYQSGGDSDLACEFGKYVSHASC